MMTHKTQLLTFLSLISVAALFLAPTAGYAHGDDDKHGDQHVQIQAQHNDDEDREDRAEDRRENRPMAIGFVDRLVAALNNQVKALERLNPGDNDDVDKDDDDAVLTADADFDHVRTLSLATLTGRLSSANAARVTTAVNANTGALQTFLNGGTDTANAIKAALADAGIAQANALAIFAFGDDHLLVITS
jgi:hypothetical protein